MNYRFIVHQLINVHKRDLSLFRQKSQISSHSLTTNTSTHRWAIKRYLLLFGLPLTSYLAYRISTKSETRRTHTIIFGSIGRVIK
jgi:hypothetical protein